MSTFRGIVTPIVVWSLVAAPLVLGAAAFFIRRAKLVFGLLCVVVAFVGLVSWIFTAGFGYRISENLSTSLSGSIYVYQEGAAVKKGDLAAFYWLGGAHYPKGTVFIKRVVGVPGDVVSRVGRDFWVNGVYVGRAKEVSRAGVPLEAADPGVIPPGRFFVATPNPDSLDSRYRLTGNIASGQLIGRAHELF